jgi:hypothetical protein
MKKRFLFFLIACMITLLVVGCAGMTPPMNEITDAKMALERAKALDAKSFAPLYFLEAKEKLEKAEDAVKQKDNEKAFELALKSKADAELAAALSQKKIAEEKAKKYLEKQD